MTPQLCLGTAQFGLPYGITNIAGQVPESEVAKLLAQLEEAGVLCLDTAQAYGNSEEVLGRNLPKGHNLRVISKLPAQPQAFFTAENAVAWEREFRLSCERLGLESLDALLLHAPADLSKPGGNYLEDWLLGLRQRGLVRRLGLSIYAAEDLEGVNPDLLDLVQLPLSLFDQRLIRDGTMTRLHAAGTAIYARSLYLQGLLLTPSYKWPKWTPQDVRRHHQRLELLAWQRRCQLIDLALGFAKDQVKLEAIVVGLCNSLELAQLMESWRAVSPWQKGEWQSWGLQGHEILDPRCWAQR
jgi:aryl-alcohol dehydrogenase-like predicted oxidoreductase